MVAIDLHRIARPGHAIGIRRPGREPLESLGDAPRDQRADRVELQASIGIAEQRDQAGDALGVGTVVDEIFQRRPVPFRVREQELLGGHRGRATLRKSHDCLRAWQYVAVTRRQPDSHAS